MLLVQGGYAQKYFHCLLSDSRTFKVGRQLWFECFALENSQRERKLPGSTRKLRKSFLLYFHVMTAANHNDTHERAVWWSLLIPIGGSYSGGICCSFLETDVTGLEWRRKALPRKSFYALLIDQRRSVKPLDRHFFFDCDATEPEVHQKKSHSERNLLTFPHFFTLFCADVYFSCQILRLSAHETENMI